VKLLGLHEFQAAESLKSRDKKKENFKYNLYSFKTGKELEVGSRMGLQDFLAPGEDIRYRCSEPVKHGGDYYWLYVTTDKLILYSRTGLIFKKDNVISHRLEEIQTMKYREEGILSKKGILEIFAKDKKIPLKGNPDSMKALWQELQKYIKA
jgi:hypothetical protein